MAMGWVYIITTHPLEEKNSRASSSRLNGDGHGFTKEGMDCTKTFN